MPDKKNLPNRINKIINKAAEYGDPDNLSQRERQLNEAEFKLRFENDLLIRQKQSPNHASTMQSSEEYRSAHEKFDKDLGSIKRQQDILDETKHKRVNATFARAVESTFNEGHISGEARRRGLREDIQQKGLVMASSTPVEEHQANIERWERQHEKLNTIANKIRGEVTDVFGEIDPKKQADLTRVLSMADRHVEKRAVLEAAGKIYKARGEDATSIQESRLDAEYRAQKVAGTLGEGSKEASAFLEAFAKFSKVIDDGSEDFKKLKATVTETEAAFRKTAAGGGDGGGGGIYGGLFGSSMGGKINRAMPWIQAATAVAGATSQGIQQIGVNQSLAVRYNEAGLAGLENQKYDMYKAARGGDIKSQMLLGKWGEAEVLGSKLKTGQNAATSFNALSALGDVAMSGLKGAAMGAGGGAVIGGIGAIPGAIAGGISGSIYGAVNVAIGTSDVARGVSGDQAKVQGTQAEMERQRQLIAIHAQQVQGFRDYSVGMGQAARGMGGKKGEEFLNSVISDSELTRMGQMGISPQQMTEMAQAGVANMGSTFDKEQIYQARQLERSGKGTMQENLQRQAMLASAGSNNPQTALSGVLEAAVGKGFDSSKSMTLLVEHTAQMAAKSTAATSGLDVGAETATMLASMADPTAKNREFALQRARNTAEIANNMVTDETNSFTNMAAVARIGNTTGFGGVESLAAKRIDIETLKKFGNMNEHDAAAELRIRGMDVSDQGVAQKGGGFKSVKEVIQGLQANAQLSLIEKGGGLAVGADPTKMLAKVNSTTKYEDIKWEKGEEAAFAQAMAATGQFKTGKEGYLGLKGITSQNDPNASTQVTKDEMGEGGGDKLKKIDRMLTGGATQLAEAAQAGAKALGGAADAFEKIVQLQQKADKEGRAKGEGEFGHAGADAAGANWFSKGGKQFEDSTHRFEAAVSLLVDGLKLNPMTYGAGLGLQYSNSLLNRSLGTSPDPGTK